MAQPPPLTSPHKLALHHLALGARDVDSLARFYMHALHLHELGRHYDEHRALRSVWLDLGGTVLMIEHTERQRCEVSGVDAGLFLFAMRVPAEARSNFERAMAALGCPCESRTEHSSYFRDPEGNRFALSSYPFEHQG